MPLFQWGRFVAASGGELDWKIECDALSDEDWRCIANACAPRLPAFGGIAYVPTGGAKLAKAFEPYRIAREPMWLVVDDVWTTGNSMLEHVKSMELENWFGFVAFARRRLPGNVRAFATIDAS